VRRVEVTTWYLEMRRREQLRMVPPPDSSACVVRAEIPSPELNRFLYTAVGGPWYWLDRLSWTYADWLRYLDRPELETWVLWVSGTPAGYVELEQQREQHVEVAYFGLLPRFVGRGLGGYLLSMGVERAWTMGAGRVWVHTCSLDGPSALSNYQARGFLIYDQRTSVVELPASPPGPWPDANMPMPG
jgi:GNAT superfamily N-acetyltransferase